MHKTWCPRILGDFVATVIVDRWCQLFELYLHVKNMAMEGIILETNTSLVYTVFVLVWLICSRYQSMHFWQRSQVDHIHFCSKCGLLRRCRIFDIRQLSRRSCYWDSLWTRLYVKAWFVLSDWGSSEYSDRVWQPISYSVFLFNCLWRHHKTNRNILCSHHKLYIFLYLRTMQVMLLALATYTTRCPDLACSAWLAVVAVIVVIVEGMLVKTSLNCKMLWEKYNVCPYNIIRSDEFSDSFAWNAFKLIGVFHDLATCALCSNCDSSKHRTFGILPQARRPPLPISTKHKTVCPDLVYFSLSSSTVSRWFPLEPHLQVQHGTERKKRCENGTWSA